MTMHLELGLTTLRTGRPRKKKNIKMTQVKLEKYEQQMRQYNKDMRKWGLSHQQLDLKKYIDYCQGNYTPKVKTEKTEGRFDVSESTVYQRPTTYVPSKGTIEPVAPNGIDWKQQQERLEVSKKYTIAPAYNKGPYMVVSGPDIKTAGRKV